MVDITTLPTGTDTAALAALKVQCDREAQYMRDQYESQLKACAETRESLRRKALELAAELDHLTGKDALAAKKQSQVYARFTRREVLHRRRVLFHLYVAAGVVFGTPVALALLSVLWRLVWKVML